MQCRPERQIVSSGQPLRTLLEGGDRRSIALVGKAVEALRAEPERIAELAALTDDADWLVVMRAFDAFEKLARIIPGALEPYKELLLGEAADDPHWEIRLQIVRSLPLFDWTERQRGRVLAILRANLDHPQKFVRAWATDSFVTLAACDPLLRAEAERAIAALEGSGSKALQTRAARLRDRLAAPQRDRH